MEGNLGRLARVPTALQSSVPVQGLGEVRVQFVSYCKSKSVSLLEPSGFPGCSPHFFSKPVKGACLPSVGLQSGVPAVGLEPLAP